MSIFGQIFTPHILEERIKTLLGEWMPTYLQEVELQSLGPSERGKLEIPKSIVSRNEFSKFPEDQLPMLVVINAGVADDPIRDGESIYGAWWAIGIGIIVSAKDEESTARACGIYSAAVRGVMIQKGGTVSQGVEWADETYDDVPTDDDQSRTLRAARLIFRVYIDDVVQSWGGPAEPAEPDPDVQPGSEWPTADTVEVVTRLVPPDGEVG